MDDTPSRLRVNIVLVCAGIMLAGTLVQLGIAVFAPSLNYPTGFLPISLGLTAYLLVNAWRMVSKGAVRKNEADVQEEELGPIPRPQRAKREDLER